jgi:hypothetical protein
MGQFYWDERMTSPSNIVSSACKKPHLRITPVINFMLQHGKILSQNFNKKTLYIKILIVYLGTKTFKQNDYTNHNTKNEFHWEQ